MIRYDRGRDLAANCMFADLNKKIRQYDAPHYSNESIYIRLLSCYCVCDKG